MRAYESYRRRQARRDFLHGLLGFAIACLGLTWITLSALIGSELFGDDKPFTNFFHFIMVGHMIIGLVVTCAGIFKIARS